MVSKHIEDEIWKFLFHTNTYVRYYDGLANNHLKKYRWLRFWLLVFAAGELGAVMKLLPDFLEIYLLTLLPFSIIVLVAVDFVADNGRKASMLHVIGMECSELEIEVHRLWTDRERIEDDEAIERVSRVSQKLLESTGKAGKFGIEENSKLHEKSTKDATEYLTNHYAT